MKLFFLKLFSIYRSTKIIYLVAPTFFLLASLYSVVVPLYEVPDEVGHFGYVLHLRQTKQLPIQQVNSSAAAHHPPLYYIIAALASFPGDPSDQTGTYRPNLEFVWSGHGGDDINISRHRSAETFPYRGRALILHLARLVSVLMGTGTVIYIFLIGRKIFPPYPEIGGLAATLVALNPQFLFISGAVNNDNLITLTITALCFHLLCAINSERPTMQWLLAGLWLNIGVLAKVNGLLFIVVIFLSLAIQAWQRRSLELFIKNGLAIGTITMLLSGWWFIRNWMLYGDILGWSIYTEITSTNLRQAPLTMQDIRFFFDTQFNTFWSRFGWGSIWAPDWFYLWIKYLLTIASAGVLFFIIRKWKVLSTFQRTALFILSFMAIIHEGYMLWAITKFNESWYQGRYIFPIMAPLMIAMSLGLLNWITERFRAIVCLFLFLTMFAVALYMPLYVIQPAYTTITQSKWHAWLLPNRTEYQFGESILLRGYEVKEDDSQLILSLHWQALQTPDFNYSAFVHLLDENDNILLQDDHAPGEQVGYPPMVWEPEDIVAGHYTLDTTGVILPDQYQFRVGLYNWETGQRLDVQIGEKRIGDFVILE